MREYPLSDADIERFWSKVDKSEGCWVWRGKPDRDGYGCIQLARPKRKRLAHRVAYQIANGEIPDGMYVLHRCPGKHNPLCVNPEHLIAGTPWQNMQDKYAQGTMACGSRQGNSRLHEDDIPEIRHMLATGHTQWDVARRFKVKQSIISDIKLGKRWTHVPDGA